MIQCFILKQFLDIISFSNYYDNYDSKEGIKVNLSAYERDVKEASNKKLDKRFPNSSLAHARLLTKEIIKSADKEIWLLTSDFNSAFYMSIQKEIEDFLNDPSHIFQVIVASNHNTFLKDLIAKFPNQLKVKQVNKEQLPKDNDTQEYVNYILNDTNAYRYEYSEKNIKEGIVEAIANFYSPKETSYLKDNFKSLLNVA